MLALGVAGGAGALLVSALFLVALAAKERDNRFCVSCHLHEDKFKRLTAATPADLAGLHHGKDPKVGCIACHGGADLRMRLAVWTVAGIDTLKFLSGAYGEPTHMRLPLRDAECRQCHTPVLPVGRRAEAAAAPTPAASPPPAAAASDESAAEAEAQSEGRGGTSYHAIREHDAVKVACVRCHTTHTTDSRAADRFLAKTRVVPVCRECHKEM